MSRYQITVNYANGATSRDAFYNRSAAMSFARCEAGKTSVVSVNVRDSVEDVDLYDYDMGDPGCGIEPTLFDAGDRPAGKDCV